MTVNEPMPPGPAPVCPAWFRADALDEWRRIVPVLDKLGMLTQIDHAVLVGHCATYCEIVETVKANKPLKAALLGQMRAYAVELGMTPAARAKLSIAPPKNEDPFQKYFQ